MSEAYFQVALRLRKLLLNEDTVAWVANNNHLQSITNHQGHDSKQRPRVISVDQTETHSFTYDSIEQEQKTQGLYARLCRPLVKQSISGYHATILCYGQTTSGKTYTILGTPDNPGVLPCALRDVFTHKLDLRVWVQYIQIYNEQLDDLLSESLVKLTITDDNQWGTQIQGARKVKVNSFEEAIQLLNEGEDRRIYRATKVHDQSSRSHTMFKMYIENTTSSRVTFACLNLVDLAGSERLSDVDTLSHTETGYINKSLFTLTNVINKLAEHNKHVPFRDSKLTRLLRDSLGGNAYTLLLCCISPARKNIQQTLSTLKFANRAKLIKNAPELQTILDPNDPRDAEIHLLKSQLHQCQQTLLKQQQQNVQQSPCCVQQITKLCIQIEPSLVADRDFSLLKQLEDQYDRQISNINSTYLEQLQGLRQTITDYKIIQLIDHVTMFMSQCFTIPSISTVLNKLTLPQQQSSLLRQILHEKDKIQTNINLQHLSLQREKIKKQGLCKLLERKFQSSQDENKFEIQIEKFNNDLESTISQIDYMRGDMTINRDQLSFSEFGSQQQVSHLDTSMQSRQRDTSKSIRVVTNDPEMPAYLWGSNQDGRLGVGAHTSIAREPQLLRKFSSIVCGSHHTMALTVDGRVFVWGRGQKGQLGLQGRKNIFEPEQLSFKFSVVQVASGWQHSVSLDSEGQVFTWGYGENGQLGHGDCLCQEEPKLIKGQNAQRIFAGYSNTAFLSTQDELYTFGSNWDGRCMVADLGIISTPQLALKDKILCLSLGVSHMGVVMSSGQLIMAGTGTEGQLGVQLDENQAQTIALERVVEDLGGSDDQITYEKELASTGVMVTRFSKGGCQQVACGDRFTLALNNQGRVYAFGKHSYHKLGFLTKEDIFEPTAIMTDVQYIAVGCRHAGAITKQNELYMWGFNFHNQLGLGGNDQDQEMYSMYLKIKSCKDSDARKSRLDFFGILSHSSSLVALILIQYLVITY